MLRAVIFDCDGVIVNSEPHHLTAFREALKGEGISLSTAEYYSKYLAMDDKACFEAVLRAKGRRTDADRIARLMEKKMALYERLSHEELVLYPGVVNLVNTLKERYRLAIASGALHEEVRFAVEKGRLQDAFPVLVAAQDVRNGKPHPEAFQTALARLNGLPPRPVPPIQPAECLVIEDSVHGIEGARSAGMKCLAVTNSYPKEKLTRADLVVESLEKIRLEDLEKLF